MTRQSDAPGVKLPNTLIFDYPTVSAISNFAASQVGATSGSAAAFAAVQGGFAGGTMPMHGFANREIDEIDMYKSHIILYSC